MIFKTGQIINLIDDSWSTILPNSWTQYRIHFSLENVAKFKIIAIVEDLLRLKLMEICDSNGRVIINLNTEVDVHSDKVIESINFNLKR